MKYVEEVRKRFREMPAFTITDLRVFLRSKGIGTGYLHLLVHNLRARGELRRISKGAYTFHDDAQVVGFAYSPFYYGLQEALSLWNLWEQETTPVVITPRKVRSGMRTFEGGNYTVRRIKRGMFFGFTTMKYGNFWIPVSNVEKTLVDFVYFNEPLSAETLKEIRQRANIKRLHEYLKRCPARVRKKAMGMLATAKR